jgi:hypothetical protein
LKANRILLFLFVGGGVIQEDNDADTSSAIRTLSSTQASVS